MASINKVILVGNLGSDPEIRYTGNGQAVTNLSVATNEKWIDKNTGKNQEKTEWHHVVVWGKIAENCCKFLKKGKTVYVEGKIQTREYVDPKDNTQKKYVTEIIATNVQFLGESHFQTNNIPEKNNKNDIQTNSTVFSVENTKEDDDIPF